jgi:hypothetical protein
VSLSLNSLDGAADVTRRRTEPEAFFIDVYFNAHPIPSGSQADTKHKLKAPNALIPTVIAYSGGNTEFSIDMGADARLLSCHLQLETDNSVSLEHG